MCLPSSLLKAESTAWLRRQRRAKSPVWGCARGVSRSCPTAGGGREGSRRLGAAGRNPQTHCGDSELLESFRGCAHARAPRLLQREGSVGRDSCVPLQARAFFGGPPLTALCLLHSSALTPNNVKVNVIPVPWCSATLLTQAQGPALLLRVKHPVRDTQLCVAPCPEPSSTCWGWEHG